MTNSQKNRQKDGPDNGVCKQGLSKTMVNILETIEKN